VKELENRQLLSLTTLASFDGTNGDIPNSLVMDGQGNLYGTAHGGGAYNDGIVFEIAKGSNTITDIASFNGTNGTGNNSLIMDSQGNLFGTTSPFGVSILRGTVFEIAKGSNTITDIASFGDINDGHINNGFYPNSLVMDHQGNLFGTTSEGGANNDGTVFEVVKGSNTITYIASFNNDNGSEPNSLVMDSQGNLYGATRFGGSSGYGAVFEIAKGSNTITNIASFDGNNGWAPNSLVMDSQGNFFGTTESGGASHTYGNVFEIVKGSNTITNIASFNGNNGSGPNSLVVDSQGNLYGATFEGGGPWMVAFCSRSPRDLTL
jgi:uncharacterized repeat protein (TIGR03803 family)